MRVGILTGGGDCPGLNAVIRAAAKTLFSGGVEVLGFRDGYRGIIEKDWMPIDKRAISGLLHRGGTILGTNNRDNPFNFPVVTAEGKKLKKKDLKDIENGWVVECIPLKGRELVRWLQEEAISRGNELPTAAAEYLRFSCGENPALLSQEIEKASLYLGKKQRRITVDVFQSVGSRTAGRTLFELVDAVAERKGSAAVEVLQELLAQGKPPVLLVSMLSRHYLQMLEAYWLLEEGVSPGELSGVMVVHPFVAKKLMKQIRSYHLSEIEKILDGLLELDLSLKKGKGSPELLMTSFLGTV
jgi:DNA polymerase-3 subunit delta